MYIKVSEINEKYGQLIRQAVSARWYQIKTCQVYVERDRDVATISILPQEGESIPIYTAMVIASELETAGFSVYAYHLGARTGNARYEGIDIEVTSPDVAAVFEKEARKNAVSNEEPAEEESKEEVVETTETK